MVKKDIDSEINPNSFYQDINGIFEKKRGNVNLISKKREVPKSKDDIITKEEILPKFDSESYKETANKTLEDIGAEVRVYKKSSYHILLAVLIGVIIIFGLYFSWSISNDKFKTDFNCPDCVCPQAELSCPAVEYPACNCNQNLSCPSFNNSEIIQAINNLTISINNSCP